MWATTAFSSVDPSDAAKSAGSSRPARFYTRYGNPTVQAFEEAVASLEGAESALARPLFLFSRTSGPKGCATDWTEKGYDAERG